VTRSGSALLYELGFEHHALPVNFAINVVIGGAKAGPERLIRPAAGQAARYKAMFGG
jgi:hypothetical protein